MLPSALCQFDPIDEYSCYYGDPCYDDYLRGGEVTTITPTTSSSNNQITTLTTDASSTGVMEVSLSPSWLGVRINSERVAIGFLTGIIFVLSKFTLNEFKT